MSPPALLEYLFGLLLPPACREHVLGDLHERCQSPRQYLRDGLSVLGPVIISRIRRTTDVQVFVVEAFSVYLSFAAAAFYLRQERFLYLHAGFAVLLLPSAIAAVALLFCNAYSDLQRKSFSRPILQTAGSIALAYLGQAAVFDTQPRFAVPISIMLEGSLLSFVLVSVSRVSFPPAQSRPKLASLRMRRFGQAQKIYPSGARRSKWNMAAVILAAVTATALMLAVISAVNHR